MSPEEKASLHAAVLRNTAQNPAWLGYWLARHQQSEDLDEQQLADKLGIAMDNLVLLCLCRTPRDDQFKADLEAVCQRHRRRRGGAGPTPAPGAESAALDGGQTDRGPWPADGRLRSTAATARPRSHR